jgi:hypothetical protein
MNDSNLEAIVSIIAVLGLLAIVLLPFAAFIIYVIYQKISRERTRQRILREHQQTITNNKWFPVRYASEVRFKALFKIFPWESAGIMVMFPGSVLFYGPTSPGAPVALQFAPGNSTINWLGKAPWPNGAVSWFYFDTAAQKHYFSSETGVLVFGSHKSTKEIYEAVAQSFQAHSPSRV